MANLFRAALLDVLDPAGLLYAYSLRLYRIMFAVNFNKFFNIYRNLLSKVHPGALGDRESGSTARVFGRCGYYALPCPALTSSFAGGRGNMETEARAG